MASLPGIGLLGAAAGPVVRAGHDATVTAVGVSQALSLAALDRVLASRFAEDVVDRVVASPAADRLARQAVESPVIERLVTELLDSPAMERLVVRVLDAPGMERLVNRAIDSRLGEETMTRLIEEVTARLAASRGLWALVDEVAASPAIGDAIAAQSMGFADQVGDEVRDRSRTADAWLESVARRILRRRAATVPSPPVP
jgi:hypothetical protein